MNLLPPGSRLGFGRVRYPPGGVYGPRTQWGLQLVSLIDGELTVRVDARRHRLAPGDSILLLPGRREYFEFSSHRHSRHTWCQFEAPAFDRKLLSALERVPPVAPSSKSLDALMQMARGLQAAGPRHAGALRAVAVALLREHLATCGFGTDAPGGTRVPSPAVVRALRFMEENLEKPLTAAALSQGAGTSYQHLARLCARDLGCSPLDALWRRRCERAAALLRATGLSLTGIAEQCGFASEQHFSRRFRARFGTPPGAFRSGSAGRK